MLSNVTDYVNSLLNKIVYFDLDNEEEGNVNPGDNLCSALNSIGQKDLADKLIEAGLGNLVIKEYINHNESNGFAAIAFEDPETGDVGISFRGTENLPDIGSDMGKILAGDSGALNHQADMLDNMSTAITGDSAQVSFVV